MACIRSFFVSLLILTGMTIGMIQLGHLLLGRFFQLSWILPSLLLLAAFLSGVLVRKWINRYEHDHTGLLHLIMAIAAFCSFSGITWWDIHQSALASFTFYSRFLPMLWDPAMAVYVYILPAAGLLGLIFSPYFCL